MSPVQPILQLVISLAIFISAVSSARAAIFGDYTIEYLPLESSNGRYDPYPYFVYDFTRPIKITGYQVLGGDVVIPSQMMSSTQYIISEPVVEITNFGSLASLTSVMIPGSVKKIGEYNFGISSGAFSNCINLTSVIIEDGVTLVGSGTFSGCSKLSSITVPPSAFLASSVFAGCSSLTTINGGANWVGQVGYDTFSGCSSLVNINIGGDIHTGAFGDCASLENVVLTSGVGSIQSFAFYGCTKLRTITIPSSVGSIGGAPFPRNPNLSEILVDPMNSSFSSFGGVLFNKEKTVLIQCPGGLNGNYVVPSSVDTLGDFGAFQGCGKINSVSFRGNAPGYQSGNTGSVFGTLDSENFNGVVYYLPGTTGWEATFDGRPTVMALVPTTQPANIATNKGTNASFSAAFTGIDLTYQWRKDGVDLPGRNLATLELTHVQPADAGSYTVVASNPLGSVTSNAAVLTIYPDNDEDGLTDLEETTLTQTNPNQVDSDGDGTPDPQEDPDLDGLTNLAEVTQYRTNPLLADSDGDGIDDRAEINFAGSYFKLVPGSFNHAQASSDASSKRGRVASFPNSSDYSRMASKARQTTQGYLWIGLSDATSEGTWRWTDGSATNYARWLNGQPSGGATENHAVIMDSSVQWADTMASFTAAGYLFERIGLDPLDPDTDADGLRDGREVNTTLSSPVLDDTDGDGLLDGAEVDTHGSSPLLADTDADGLSDRAEVEVHGSNPALKDSDADGFEDGFEVNTGFNPALDTSTPDAISSIRTAVEFRFNAANGVSYRIEGSTDLNEWDIIETDIIGASAVVTRFYSTENQPRRYFRARRN